MPHRAYRTHRMHLIFEKGPLFYAEFNLRLFFFLLFHKSNLLVSNDLDTLLPNYMIRKLKKLPLVYDSHELFTETPEVIHRKFVKGVWERIEKAFFPRVDRAITVSDSIAEIFTEKYGRSVTVVRNIPPNRNISLTRTKKELGIDPTKKILVLQGAGINIQRGVEELIGAMEYLESCQLLIIGGGDVVNELKQQAEKLVVAGRILFFPRMPVEDLYQYTMQADLGLSLDKDTNLNYRYSLPNKLFDYIHAGIPIVASPLVEVRKIIEGYDIGTIINNHEPEHIASIIKEVLSDQKQIEKWKENLKFAASELNWSAERLKLADLFKPYA